MPGLPAPETGAYWVHHYQHRVSHPVTVPQGTLLPACNICGERVRYERNLHADGAPSYLEDRDLCPPSEQQLA